MSVYSLAEARKLTFRLWHKCEVPQRHLYFRSQG